jgi:hypothetical protein
MINTKNVETSIHVLFAVNKASLALGASPAYADEKNILTNVNNLIIFIHILYFFKLSK